ncbi:MAG: glycosyltransferase family 2 protein [Planctomycetes bacterium]|nr:glycosyltransferase family 2 protein [Planctomycetota bacterium]
MHHHYSSRPQRRRSYRPNRGKILACDYPGERFSLNLVADNCTDDTADRAREAGANVIVRVDPEKRGKGQALAYALEVLKNENSGEPGDAVLFLDADSSPESDYLRVMASHLVRGDVMIQGRYDVEGPDRNWFTRLTATSFVLRNRWQFPAYEALGLTIPLRGSGMCFERSLIYRLGWQSYGLTEDMEMTLRLIREKSRSPMERGRYRGSSCQPLPEKPGPSANAGRGANTVCGELFSGKKSPTRCDVAIGVPPYPCFFMVTPPFSMQLCVAMVLLVPAWLVGGWVWNLSVLILLLLAGYFFLGLERLDKQGLAAAAMLPVFALWRVGVYLTALFKKPAEWIRTVRSGK